MKITNNPTPGPWEVATCPETGPYVREVPSYKIKSWPVPEIIIGEMNNPADANLVAAAPEMFDALNAMVNDEKDAWEKVYAALAKAKGPQ